MWRLKREILQQWRQQSDDALEQSLQERSLHEIRHIVHQDALRLILQINLLDALRHALVEEEGIRLEIVLETTEVDVGAAHGAEIVVAHQELAVVEGILIEIYLHASLHRFHQIRAGCPLHQLGVGMARHHQPNVNPSQCCRSHGKQHRLGWQEVWGLHIYVVLRLEQDAHVALHDVGPWADRTARYYLYQAVVVDRDVYRRIILAVGYQCAVYEIPVYQECSLDGVHAASLDTKMGIAPTLSAVALHIAQGDVHAADESHLAIYHAQLTVVAIIHLAREGREAHRHEGMHIDSGISHALKEAVLHLPTPHIIVNQSDLHALLRLVDQGVGDEVAQRVFLDDIGIEMDMLLGLSYII